MARPLDLPALAKASPKTRIRKLHRLVVPLAVQKLLDQQRKVEKRIPSKVELFPTPSRLEAIELLCRHSRGCSNLHQLREVVLDDKNPMLLRVAHEAFEYVLFWLAEVQGSDEKSLSPKPLLLGQQIAELYQNYLLLRDRDEQESNLHR